LRRGGVERIFKKTDRFPLQILRQGEVERELNMTTSQTSQHELAFDNKEDNFWDKVHAIEQAFHNSLEKHEPKETTNALLELDRTIWKALQDLENPEFISQARDTLRELIVSLGVRLESAPKSRTDCLAPLVESLLELRKKFRSQKQYDAADAIRETLKRASIIVEDTRDGSRWRLK
jgi:cysteinyl-tRNA synthetase